MIPERPPAQVNQGTGHTKVERPDAVTVAGRMENGALLSGLWSGVAPHGAEPNATSFSGHTLWVVDEAAGQLLRFDLT